MTRELLQWLKSKISIIIAALTAIIVVATLFIPNLCGFSDNGDFNRALTPSGMDYQQSASDNMRYFDYVNPMYSINNPLPIAVPVYLNTHLLTVATAKLLNMLIFSKNSFSIASIGILYLLIFIAGIYYLFKQLETQVWLKNFAIFASIVFVFADNSNTLYFNSLFAEANAYVFLIISVALLFRICVPEKPVGLCHAVLFFITLGLSFGSKVQYSLLYILFVPSVFWIVKLFNKRKQKVIIWLVFIFMCTVNIAIYKIQPDYLDDVTTYDSVFGGIVTSQETAEQYLDELGLSREYAVLAGTHGFMDEYPIDINSEEFRQGFYNKISKLDLAAFYIKHPDLLLKQLRNTATVAFIQRPEYLGNYTYGYSKVNTKQMFFSAYSFIKKQYMPQNFEFILAIYITYFIIVLCRFLKKKAVKSRILNLFVLIVIIFSGIQFALPTVGNGGMDLSKQLYMFNVMFDMLILCEISTHILINPRRINHNNLH